MELVDQGNLQMGLKQFHPAIETFSEALEGWPDNDEINGLKTAAVEALAQAEKEAAEKEEQEQQEKAATAAVAAAAALLAKLDELRASAEAAMANRSLDSCVSICTQALALDQSQEYEGRVAIERLKEEGSEKAKALKLMTYGREQLAAKDFRFVLCSFYTVFILISYCFHTLIYCFHTDLLFSY